MFNNVAEIRKVQARGRPEKYLVAKTISVNDLLNQLQRREAVWSWVMITVRGLTRRVSLIYNSAAVFPILHVCHCV